MTMKKDAKRTTRKKLTLSKETLRDLDPKRAGAKVKGGGVKTNRVGVDNCP